MNQGLMLSSPMTEREFGIVFSKLAMQLRCTDADAVTIKSYFEALQDLPLEALQVSAAKFAQERGRRFFPTSAEWFEAAERAQAEQLKQALIHRAEPWHFDDEACKDTGWREHECDGERGHCGRSKKHQPHTYVTVCPCRPTNRTYQRHARFGSGE